MALITKKITLDITPGAIPQTVNVSQKDIGRAYEITLMDEGGVFEIPTGTTAKVEGTIAAYPFSVDATVTGNTVSFQLAEAMTAVNGKAWTKVMLTKDDEPVSSCAFILNVDRAGVEAKTIINAPGFQEQIQNAVNAYLDEHGTGGDADALKQMLYLMLVPILRESLYGVDQDAAISALEDALGAVPVVTQTVTNNLTNVATSNNATVVVKGTAYAATLTPVDGAVIRSVAVTMGGVDVTSSVYSNGTISISSVTGDIIITAMAEAVIETYTPTMSEGYINVTTGATGGTSSYMHTEIIPVREGDKVYGSSWDSTYSQTIHRIRARFTAAYDANDAIYPAGGNSEQTDYTEDSPLVIPSGVYGVVFSIINNLATQVVVYVDKSERVGA